MNDPLITICTVNYNSSEFIMMMLYSFRKLNYYPYKVIIRDNNSKKKDYEKLKNFIKNEGLNNIHLYRINNKLIGSEAHGVALNELVSRIDTQYGVIIDADAMFLIKDWDKILIDKITPQQPIYGTQANTLGNKPKDFPLMFAIVFITDILKDLNINFKPRDINKFEDTGWELREKYLSKGLKVGLLYDFNTRLYKNGPFSKVICSEYYLSPKAEEHIFASHFGRGSSPKAKNLVYLRGKSIFLIRVINKCLQYVNIIKWKKDKNKWLNICKKIIDEQ